MGVMRVRDRIPFPRDLRLFSKDYKDVNLVFSVSRALGLFHLTKKGEYSKLLCSTSFLIISTASVAAAVCTVTSILNFLESSDVTDSFWSATDLIRCSLGIISLFTQFFRSVTKKKKLQRCYVRVLYLKPARTTNKDLILVMVLFSVRTMLYAMQLYVADSSVRIIDASVGELLAYMFTSASLLVLQMTTLVDIIAEKFDEFIKLSPKNYLQTDRHSQIIDSVAETLVLFEVSLLLFTLSSLIEMISLGYHSFVTAYKTILTQQPWYIMYTAVNVTSITIVLISLLKVVRTCENVTFKTDLFYKELFRLMREDKTLCTNKKLNLYMSMRKSVNFSACGFFNLGYPLITSMLAAATTYLVLLIQFSLSKASIAQSVADTQQEDESHFE